MVPLQKQFEDAVSPSSLAASRQNPTERRAAAKIELENQIRKLLGDERYNKYIQEQIRTGRRLRR
jgi:hypothetical protein